MSIGIIGAGAFGTSLAITMAQHGQDVRLWSRANAAKMQTTRVNHRYLPDAVFPDSLTVVSALTDLTGCAAILLVLPAQQTAGFLRENQIPAAPLVLCAKGIDVNSGALQTQIAAKYTDAPLSVLTGPGFASDLAKGLPTALTLASFDAAQGRELQHLLSTPRLRLYLSDDPIGAQLGGALKNVIALACGMTIGAGLGESARAAVLTRGFAEMLKVGVEMGAKPETFQGLSGLGDLTLTCGSEKSRNFAQGLAIGCGKMPESGVTVEGVATAQAAAKYANVDTPIADAVSAVISQKITLTEAMDALLSRPLKQE
ncbi:MAG: NAD(P)-dependent glycerol-3-phosphate dehydrogenase [Rhodobacteraceae bacterium]|nr:NAD(P)-dependent glycerol-3-phosphate dehydrogenase [Paracoccaceae bacterium]